MTFASAAISIPYVHHTWTTSSSKRPTDNEETVHLDIRSKLAMDHCMSCESITTEICVGCKKLLYCSRACQKKHWSIHKKSCGDILRSTYKRLCVEVKDDFGGIAPLLRRIAVKQSYYKKNRSSAMNAFRVEQIPQEEKKRYSLHFETPITEYERVYFISAFVLDSELGGWSETGTLFFHPYGERDHVTVLSLVGEYNEEACVPDLLERLGKELNRISFFSESICTNSRTIVYRPWSQTFVHVYAKICTSKCAD